MRKDNLTNHSQTAEAVTPVRKEKRIGRQPVESPTKAIVEKLHLVEEKRLLRQKTTIGLYSLKCKDGYFGLPYCAVNDHFALLAQKQLLPVSDCYKVGTMCLFDGSVKSCKPVIILDTKVGG